ncbi:MAG: LuxR C-terminal-related transcriptional regulator [Muribaculaceae bacterium]|nr:LuxR C-terminal-related transcriptional regulator [Muribaculaceae bacterium]
MRKLLYFIPLFILAVACKGPRPIDQVFPWPASGVPEADTLTLALTRSIARGTAPADSLRHKSYFNRFAEVVKRHPENELVRLRYNYFRLCRSEAEGNLPEWNALYDSVISKLDTTRYKYDYYKLRSLKVHQEIDQFKGYLMASRNFEYARSVGDNFEMCRSAIVLGNMLTSIGDRKSAERYYQLAIDVARQYGFDDVYYSATLNITQFYDSTRSVSTLNELLSMPLVKRSPDRRAFLLFALFDRTKRMAYVDSSISLQDSIRPDRRLLPLLYRHKGDEFVEMGKVDSAGKYFKLAEASLGGGYNRPDTFFIKFRRAEAYEHDEKLDSAFRLMSKAFISLYRYYGQLNVGEVYGKELKSRIDLMERNMEVERTRTWAVVSLVVFGVIAIALVFVLYYRQRAMEKKHKTSLYEEKLRHSREAMALRRMMTDEKDSLIANIAEVIDKEKTSGLTDNPLLAGLTKLLQSYKGLEEDRNSAVKVKEELEPSVAVALKRDFPTLTRGQVKMASMIIIGADNRQIARALNISLESVWKGRYRLRSRLGCDNTTNLEDFLRAYADKNINLLPEE